ncbi:MAG: hypothetical protein HY540_00495 [Deltaproteobacteria bacterium]|nr:hypothetical protein [Deltaproteobacteria bacterium]
MKKIFLGLLFFVVLPTLVQASTLQDHPKVRVAVANFGATDRFTAVYGGWNIGGGLSAQLVTELIKTGRMVVVERAMLSKVLIEQELGESQLVAPMTKAPSGHLLGVDYLIVGEVTEFEERQMGGGMAAGFLGVKTSGEIRAAHVGMDLRVVDTRTGEIICSHRAQGKAWEKAVGAKVNYKIIDFGGDLFHKTPLGKATRHAIGDAVEFIEGVIQKQVEDFSWLARIISVEQGVIYLNAGSNRQVNVGDRLIVSTVKKVLTDPETNQVIGVLEDQVGTAEAIHVDRKFTKARLLGASMARVGDVVRFRDAKSSMKQKNSAAMSYGVME